ncbi:MAG: hypothetical protein ACI9OJ_004798 [Myxococcota bacterium]
MKPKNTADSLFSFASWRALLPLILAPLVVLPGCDEMAEVFANQEEHEQKKRQEQKASQDRAERGAVAAYEPPELARARARLAREDLGPEPADAEGRALWNIRHRLRCDKVECTTKYRKAIEAIAGAPAALAAVADSGEGGERREALDLLGLMGAEAHAMTVARQLNHEQSKVRLAACGALSWIKNPEATPAILNRLVNAKDPTERRCLLSSLRGRPGKSAVLSLGAAALRPKIDEALAAIAALKGRDDDQSVAVLEQAVSHATTWTVRRSAVEALGDLKSPASRAAMKRATRSKDTQVRTLALRLSKSK